MSVVGCAIRRVTVCHRDIYILPFFFVNENATTEALCALQLMSACTWSMLFSLNSAAILKLIMRSVHFRYIFPECFFLPRIVSSLTPDYVHFLFSIYLLLTLTHSHSLTALAFIRRMTVAETERIERTWRRKSKKKLAVIDFWGSFVFWVRFY